MTDNKPYFSINDFNNLNCQGSSRTTDPISIKAILKEFQDCFIGGYIDDTTANEVVLSKKIIPSLGTLYWNTSLNKFKVCVDTNPVIVWQNYDLTVQNAATLVEADRVQIAADRVQTGADRAMTSTFVEQANTAAAEATIQAATAETAATTAVAQTSLFSTPAGAGLVGASDSASGTIWTTVQGFIDKLLSSTGPGLVGYSATATYPAGSVGAQLKAFAKDHVSVKDYGAVGDGVTNDWPAIALAVAGARGRGIFFPKGNYLCNTDGGTITLEEVELFGENVLDGANGTLDQGSILLITGTTNVPFKVRRGTGLHGLGVYWPGQPDSATPTVYPVFLQFDFTNGPVQFVKISRCSVFNAYRFCDVDNGAGGAVGHVEISDNYICALNRGLYVRYNAEHFRVQRNNFTFGFWLAATEAGSAGYMRANATAIEAAQSDGLEISDNLFFGYMNGVLAAGVGLCQFMNISLNKFDQVRYPIKATGAGNFNGTITGNSFIAFNSQATSLQGRAIDITTTGTAREYITITGNNFLLATEDHIFVSGDGPARTIVVGPQNWISWAAFKAAGTYGALNVSGALTNLVVTGGWFEGGSASASSIGITGIPNTLTLTGAAFSACQNPINISTNIAMLTGNVSYATAGATSDVVAATTINSTGNRWDKPSTSSTKPFFVARKSASQTFSSATATDVVWGTESFDKGGNFATPAFTAPTAGRYRFAFSLTHDNTGTAGDRWQLLLVTGGGTFSQSYKMIADSNSVGFSADVELVTGQTARVQVQRVGGAGNFITFNDGSANYFTGSLIE
jgi:hypothetical protein